MRDNHTFQDLIAMTRTVIAAFDAVEQRPWPIEVTMIELMKQVGDLAKHVMMTERYYLADRANHPHYQTSTEDLADELADIFYCLIRVAEHYQIDLEVAHIHARRKEMQYLGEEQRFTSDLHRYQTTFVAVASDGTILSTAHYRVYERRDADGIPRRVGELDPVATRSDAQRQGHATQLITFALDAMQQDACDWSILETSEVGRPLYQRFGWQAFPMRYQRGALANHRPVCPTSYRTRLYQPPIGAQDWAQFARLYTAYNATRPLTVVRNPTYWQIFTAVRLMERITNEQMHIFGAWSADTSAQPCGYILVHFFDFAFLVKEIGVLPDDTSAITALLAAVGDEASRRGLLYGEVELPHEAPLDAIIADLFGASLHLSDANARIMARPINPRFSAEQLEAIFQAPNAFYSGIDHF